MTSKKVRFSVEMQDGTRPEVDGYLVAPGLGVQRALAPDGTVLEGMWNVVHIDSGRRACGSFATRRAAIKAAEEFAPLADWTKPDGSGEFRGILARVQAIRDRILMTEAGFVVTDPVVKAATTVPVQDITGRSEERTAEPSAGPEVVSRRPEQSIALGNGQVGFF